MNLRAPARVGGGLPLDAGRKPGAASAAQAGFQHRIDRRRRPDGARPLQSGEAAMRTVILQRQRIDHAATGKGQAGLLRQERQLLRRTEAQRMRATGQQAGGQQRRDVGCGHRTVSDAAGRRGHLDHRFEPEQTARTGAHDRRVRRQRPGHGIGAKRQRGGISRHENRGLECAHATLSNASSSRAGSRRANGWPSSNAAGPIAHKPRQKTGSKVTAPSDVVSCQPMFNRERT